MKLTMHAYKNDEDYWGIREFLRQVMLANQRRELSWHVARWDYWWWFANADREKIPPEENIFIWETGNGEIVAVLNPEGRGQAFLQYRSSRRGSFRIPGAARNTTASTFSRIESWLRR